MPISPYTSWQYIVRGMVVVYEKACNFRSNNVHDQLNDRPDSGTFVYDSLCSKVFRYMAAW